MKKLYLSETDRKVGGVCGGIGETYDIDPTLIRLIFVFVDLATGIIPLLVAYVVAWAIIPKRPIA
jgi:phage shock protein C